MSPREANAVLALAGQYDGRKADAEMAIEWARSLDGLRLDDCIAAVRAYYRDGDGRWVMPAEIRRRVNAIREDRVSRGRGYLAPPRWLDDIEDDGQHAIEYQRWLQGAEEALANGEEPDTATRVAGQQMPKGLRAEFPKIAKAIDEVQAQNPDEDQEQAS